jgi:hypothetical protein
MGMFDGTAPPNVESTKATGVVAPDYLTNYLTQLAQQGQQSLGVKDPKTGAFTTPTYDTMKTAGEPYVAPLSQLQKDAATNAPTDLYRYQDPMDSAYTAGKDAMGISQADISKFYNPYENAVVGGMGAQSATNVQRNLMPQLKAGFVGSGGLGSQRYANAMGQTMGDVNTSLLQEQTKARSAGYQSALDAALKEMGGQAQATQALGTLGAQEQQAATTGLKSQADIGAIEQAQNQAMINAPTTMAGNVAQILRGYTYPTTTTETYKGPAASYGPSQFQQMLGLGTLVGSGMNSTNTGWFDKLGKSVSGLLTPTAANVSFAGTNADGVNVYYNSSTGGYMDSSGNSVAITGD